MQQPEVKIIEKASDMEPNEIREVKKIIENAFRQQPKEIRHEKAISRYIKAELDKADLGWNCVVGKDFGAHVVHQSKKYAFLQAR
jgi:dynein light chain LC8-type